MKHLKQYIGVYMLGLLALGIWADWQEQELWVFWLMIPVVFWQLPPFSWKQKIFTWAAGKDPLGLKRLTENYLRNKPYYYWIAYVFLLWAIASILVSLISGEPTIVLIG